MFLWIKKVLLEVALALANALCRIYLGYFPKCTVEIVTFLFKGIVVRTILSSALLVTEHNDAKQIKKLKNLDFFKSSKTKLKL